MKIDLKLSNIKFTNQEPQRINFILGTPFCGSTIFAHILSTGNKTFNCGELDRIKGISNISNNIYRDGNYCTHCGAQSKPCSILTPDFIQKLIDKSSTPYEIYKELSIHTKSSILIDGSKNPYWIRQVCQDTRLRDISRAIILVRRPTSFINSYIYSGKTSLRDPRVGSSIWRDTYVDSLRTVFALGIPFIIVRYEDLSDRFEEVIRNSANWFGIDKVDTSGVYDFSKTHVLGGNTGISRNKAEDTASSKTIFNVIDNDPDENLVNIAMQTPGLMDLAVNFFGYSHV